MKSLSVKILENKNSNNTKYSKVISEFNEMLDSGLQYSIEYNPEKIIKKHLKIQLKKHFKDSISIQDTVYHGCYGASSGEVLEGFKVYIDSSLFPERFIDADFDEVINIEQLCNEYGELLNIDADTHRESMDSMGIEGKSDNTYNYLGHDSYNPVPLCHANFELFDLGEDKPVTVIVKFHCGGDIRGNYTSEVVYKFDDIYEAYNAFNPGLWLIDENNLDEINRIKDLIWQDSADKELLKNELKQLIGA